MTRELDGVAGSSLRQQLEIFGEEGVSLHSLWRAVGRPSGRDPRAWAELAAPLITGYARYLAAIDLGPDRPVVWVWSGDDGEPWRVGDLMCLGGLAHLYATYLDACHENESCSRCGDCETR
jgi:hypothetical protein